MKTKYPKTPHLPWSLNLTSDDKRIESMEILHNSTIVVTEKLDGECLDGHTEICTDKGILTIGEICENQTPCSVLSFDFETKQEEKQPILGYAKNETTEDEWYEIELANGSIIRLTGDHLVWCQDLQCYRKVKYLTEGNDVLLKK